MFLYSYTFCKLMNSFLNYEGKKDNTSKRDESYKWTEGYNWQLFSWLVKSVIFILTTQKMLTISGVKKKLQNNKIWMYSKTLSCWYIDDNKQKYFCIFVNTKFIFILLNNVLNVKTVNSSLTNLVFIRQNVWQTMVTWCQTTRSSVTAMHMCFLV